MSAIIITGVGGLVGSAAAEYFHDEGYTIIGVDNDSRGRLLHDDKASTRWNIERLKSRLPRFINYSYDVRRKEEMEEVYSLAGKDLTAIIHSAAQTAHEGSVLEDFEINTIGTLNMLDLWRKRSPEAVFLYMSTIKVYGNYPNTLNYVQRPSRYDLDPSHRYYNGFDESVSIDQGMSSFFGRSKTAADLYVQEFSYQFGLRSACFRASCITGGMHSGTESHGMLSYLVRCGYTKTPYRIYGYDGLQVRDQLHALDLITAMHEVIKAPSENVVYNIGGGRKNSCSMLEAIELCEKLTGNKMQVSFHPMRTGDHRLWITDSSAFEKRYPNWKVSMSLEEIFEDILHHGTERWQAEYAGVLARD